MDRGFEYVSNLCYSVMREQSKTQDIRINFLEDYKYEQNENAFFNDHQIG